MNQWVAKYKHLPRFQKICFWILVCFIGYVIIGFFVVPPIAKHIATKKLVEILDRDTRIEKIKLNPLILKLSVLGLSIKEKGADTDFVSFSRFDVNLQISSLFRLAPVIKEVKLTSPFFKGVRHPDGRFNFTDIIEKNTTKDTPETAEPESDPFQFAVYNIEIVDGNAELMDESVNKTHRISNLSLGIPFISNLDKQIDVFVQPYFQARFNDTPITLTGQTKPFHDSLETSINVDLKEIDLPYYFAYVPVETNIRLLSGKLDLECGFYFYQRANEKPSMVAEGALALRNLAIADKQGNPILDLQEGYTKIGRSKLVEGEFHVEKITITHPEIGITHQQDSSLNVLSLFPGPPQSDGGSAKPAPEATTSANVKLTLDQFSISSARIYLRDVFNLTEGAAPDISDILNLKSVAVNNVLLETGNKTITVGDAQINSGTLCIRRQPSDEFNYQSLSQLPDDKNEEAVNREDVSVTPEETSPWIFTLENFVMDGFNVSGENLASRSDGHLTIDDIHIAAKNISTKPDSQGSVDVTLKINKEADFSLKSRLAVTPLSVNADMDVKAVALSWSQPFIKEHLNLIIKDGKFAASGKISVALDENNNPDVSFKGGSTVDKLLVYDDSGKEKLVQFQNLIVDKIDAGYPDIYANIEAITLNSVASDIIVGTDGNLNLAKIANSHQAEVAKDASNQTGLGMDEEASSDVLITIGEFRVKDGQINFTDKSVSPYFETALEDIQIQIKGLSSNKDQRADIDLSAKLDGHAPLKVTGQLNPLARDLFVDMDFDFNNMELSPVSPYSGKYIGKKIRKGKLSFDLAYLIDGSKLDASNLITIDQIELGEHVDSPDATSLPVGLGIALLKDRSGKIDLNIPVKGDFTDPEFSLGGTIMKVITNLLVKAATSPFALLGSMFGGGEDINLIYFDPGSPDPGEVEKEKLETVVTALFERPSLNLEIKGYTDLVTDRTELLKQKFNHMLISEKIKKDPDSDDQEMGGAIELTPEEYETYLKKVYKETKKALKKATDFEEPDEVTMEFMAVTVKQQIQIADEDLKLLASQRALSVKDYLLASEKIDAERIFIVEPDSLEPSSGEGGLKSRVELGIK